MLLLLTHYKNENYITFYYIFNELNGIKENHNILNYIIMISSLVTIGTRHLCIVSFYNNIFMNYLFFMVINL